ncbi:MAG: PilZ domain-containing protein [bacterium]
MNQQELINGGDQERRVFERKKIVLDKNIKAEITLGSTTPRTIYLFIKDMSEGGLKIHSDINLPPDENIPIKFFLEDILNLTVRVAWHKEVGGMHIMGLQFMDIAPDASGIIRNFMDKYSPEGRRKNFRLDRVLAVEMTEGNLSQKFYAFTLNLSTAGMRLINEFPLPENIDIPLSLVLEMDLPPVSCIARVARHKETSFAQLMIELHFVSVSQEFSDRIDAFLDKAIEGTLDTPVQKN